MFHGVVPILETGVLPGEKTLKQARACSNTSRSPCPQSQYEIKFFPSLSELLIYQPLQPPFSESNYHMTALTYTIRFEFCYRATLGHALCVCSLVFYCCLLPPFFPSFLPSSFFLFLRHRKMLYKIWI